MRYRRLEAVQEEYREFVPFLEDCMNELGFSTSEIQADIALFIANGPQYLMVQAQRGEAKTTITAIFAVWSLIHDPKFRVFIVSAGGSMATQISTLVVQLIMTMDVLECLRPDRSNGDRTSVEAFDVHYSLKGIDKSPSVACFGITSNLQGNRADLLIADDIESQKNSQTALMREQLLNITKDFTSINSTGRIIYLGTPQSIQSTYNTLPQRGFTVRIWPGRYPNAEQLASYGDMLAPLIRERIESGSVKTTGYGLNRDMGEPTDPLLLDDQKLLAKELDQGTAWFTLQHMLLTALSDAQRYPLKPKNLVVMRLDGVNFPLTVVRGWDRQHERQYSVGDQNYTLMAPSAVSEQHAALQSKIMYVDPAGGGKNGDETGYAIVGFLNSNVYLLDVNGLPGGYSPEGLDKLAAVVVRHRPSIIKVEKNFGFGSFREIIQPVVKAACEKAGIPCPQFEDDQVHGQKELRIIDTLEPVMGRGSVIVEEGILMREADSIARYDIAKRQSYSFLFQLKHITRERDCLQHDDRLDAVEGGVRHFVAALAIDQKKRIAAQEEAAHKEWSKNPLGYKHLRKGSSDAASSRWNKRARLI